MRDNIPEKEARAIIDWFVRVCIAFEPFEVSFLYFLLFIRAAGNYSVLAGTIPFFSSFSRPLLSDYNRYTWWSTTG